MPKSMSTVRPSGRTMQVAAVQVAVEDAVEHRALHERHEARRAAPPRCRRRRPSSPCTSSHGMPSSRSITSTRRVTSVGCGRGTIVARWSVSASTRAMSSMFSASSRKSSSSTIVSANSSTSAGGFASAATGMRPIRRGASHDIACDVLAHEARDLRALHLDDDLFAGAQPRRVHLRDRRRRDRRRGRTLEHVVERAPEVELDDPAHVRRTARAARGRAAA